MTADNQSKRLTSIAQDRATLSALFLRHYDYLLHYGLRIYPDRLVVEDVIQELFLHLFEVNISIASIKNEKAYLFTSLRRRILAQLKKEQTNQLSAKMTPTTTNILFSEEDLLASPNNAALQNGQLFQALNKLPWRQREAIYLRYFNGLTTKEIAAVMGIANQTVLNTLYQGLQKMRNNTVLQQLISLAITGLVVFF